MLLQTASWDWENRTIRRLFSFSISPLLFPQWQSTEAWEQVEPEWEGWWRMSYLSHPLASLCVSVPNTTNSSREMRLWNICLANWSKGYSLKSPNAIIALSTAELGSFSCCEASWKWLRVIWVQTHLQWKWYSSGSVAQADEFGRWNVIGKELDFNAAVWLLLWEAKYWDSEARGFCWPYMRSYYPTHGH